MLQFTLSQRQPDLLFVGPGVPWQCPASGGGVWLGGAQAQAEWLWGLRGGRGPITSLSGSSPGPRWGPSRQALCLLPLRAEGAVGAGTTSSSPQP